MGPVAPGEVAHKKKYMGISPFFEEDLKGAGFNRLKSRTRYLCVYSTVITHIKPLY